MAETSPTDENVSSNGDTLSLIHLFPELQRGPMVSRIFMVFHLRIVWFMTWHLIHLTFQGARNGNSLNNLDPNKSLEFWSLELDTASNSDLMMICPWKEQLDSIIHAGECNARPAIQILTDKAVVQLLSAE